MQPVFKHVPARIFGGISQRTTPNRFVPPTLWSVFMPRRKELSARKDDALYSIREYDSILQPEHFHPDLAYTQWVAVELQEETVPEGISVLHQPAGLYAVFTYTGIAADMVSFAEKIYTEWLPVSGCKLDHRAHFTRLDHRYTSMDDPASQEELWIPIEMINKTES